MIVFFRSHDAKLPIIQTTNDQKNLYKHRGIKIGKRPIWLGGIYSQGSFLWMANFPTPVADGYQNWIPGTVCLR